MDWDRAESYPDLKNKLTTTPEENASYQEAPSRILAEKNYLGYRQDLSTYLYQKMTLQISEFKELKIFSKAEEQEEEFRLRVFLALKAQREEQVQKLKEQYEKKMIVLKEKIRKAEEKKSTQQVQSWIQRFEAFLAMLITIFGAIFGRKVTKTTINQAGTTFRRMGRVGKESQDVSIAEENLKALQQQLEETQAQLEAEISKIALDSDPSQLHFDEVTIRPLKTDITIDQMAVVWWP